VNGGNGTVCGGAVRSSGLIEAEKARHGPERTGRLLTNYRIGSYNIAHVIHWKLGKSAQAGAQDPSQSPSLWVISKEEGRGQPR
jgi:hypothetical protein